MIFGISTATLSVRVDRIDQAAARLDEVEDLIGKLRSESARKWVCFDLETARRELRTVKVNLDLRHASDVTRTLRAHPTKRSQSR